MKISGIFVPSRKRTDLLLPVRLYMSTSIPLSPWEPHFSYHRAGSVAVSFSFNLEKPRYTYPHDGDGSPGYYDLFTYKCIDFIINFMIDSSSLLDGSL